MSRLIDCEAANEHVKRSSSSCFVEDFLFVQWFVLGLQMESSCLQLEWRPTTDWFQILTESNLKPSQGFGQSSKIAHFGPKNVDPRLSLTFGKINGVPHPAPI